jgi:hypothetical protein
MKYTVFADYYATGEGSTQMVLYCNRATSADAFDEFARLFGKYYSAFAEVVEGFDFNNRPAKLLVSDRIQTFLSEEECFVSYHSSFHFNFA